MAHLKKKLNAWTMKKSSQLFNPGVKQGTRKKNLLKKINTTYVYNCYK